MGLQSTLLGRGSSVIVHYTIKSWYPSNSAHEIINYPTIKCPYHCHIPSTTGVWYIKSFTNNPSTIWYINFTSAVGVREDIYIIAIAMLMLWFSILRLNVRIMASYHLLPVFDASNHQPITPLQYDMAIIYRQLVYGEIFIIRPLQSGGGGG